MESKPSMELVERHVEAIRASDEQAFVADYMRTR